MALVDTDRGGALHHGSHRRLLEKPTVAVEDAKRVDAIVVPTARTSPYLNHAVKLANRLGCPLVALCSRDARAHEARAAARAAGVPMLAFDVTREVHSRLLPTMHTRRLHAGTPFARRTDTSLKRNLGLLIGWVAGWERMVYLDDDILVSRAEDLDQAAGMLGRYAAVGLRIVGFPDNSVVCHAYRDAGGRQDTFVGGGALAVSATEGGSFFPDIYNEDWFYLLDDDRLRPVTLVGEAIQRAYDPYRDPRRAQVEEFGDDLAEGVFALLDDGRRVSDGDRAYWAGFLRRRQLFIAEVIGMVARDRELPPDRQRHMLASLWAAEGSRALITPEMCVSWLEAWRTDRDRWRTHLLANPAGLGLAKAAKYLGLGGELSG